ncbi:MAG: sulfotransferase [Pseudomonadota bacterium]
MARDEPDPWILAARACEALGQLEDQARFARTAAARPGGLVAPHRRDQLQEQVLATALYRGEPQPGVGIAGHVGALVRRVPAHPLPLDDDAPRLRTIAINLLRAGRGDDLGALLEPRAEEVLPGCAAVLHALLAELGVSVEDDGEPEFILIGGAGRSGTTLFRAMLGAHPRLHCGPEVKLVPVICQLRADWWRSLGPELAEAGIDEPRLDAAVRAFVRALLEGLGAPGQRVAEKTPHNLLHMAYLGRLFPRARFLHVIRDGRAVAASLVQQRWVDPKTGAPLWYCADLPSAARYWRDMILAVHSQAAAVPGRYLEVRYEALVSEPEATMRRVLAFLGERWSPEVLRHHEAGAMLSSRESSTEAVRAAVHGRAVDTWRGRLSEAEVASVEEVAGEVLGALGYVE